eukprot:GHVU01186949.1.p2 GENE.GHVU01186949.1~~GHVU01186949.1.p2  ORF type:complete len:134 (-),score=5.15 GHVU01186949.1:284-685(-)
MCILVCICVCVDCVCVSMRVCVCTCDSMRVCLYICLLCLCRVAAQVNTAAEKLKQLRVLEHVHCGGSPIQFKQGGAKFLSPKYAIREANSTVKATQSLVWSNEGVNSKLVWVGKAFALPAIGSNLPGQYGIDR